MNTSKLKSLVLTLFISILFFQTIDGAAQLDPYQLKAAFIYKFLLFTDFPKTETDHHNRHLSICIYGQDPFKDAFNPVIGKIVKNRILKVKNIDKSTPIDRVQKCQVIFFSKQNNVTDIDHTINAVKNSSILTIGERENFIYRGGMIRLYTNLGKTEFSVNMDNAEISKIKFRSQMLRIANIVIDN
ncbi:MAG: YfiR family protein [Deltaproteobacteria bacterium]|nr:YfiR family protein [Deltaproteobacteria bacterium]